MIKPVHWERGLSEPEKSYLSNAGPASLEVLDPMTTDYLEKSPPKKLAGTPRLLTLKQLLYLKS
jgi:hypothetical protein